MNFVVTAWSLDLCPSDSNMLLDSVDVLSTALSNRSKNAGVMLSRFSVFASAYWD